MGFEHQLRIPFSEDKKEFNRTEKYIQYLQAKYFADEEAMNKILNTDDPVTQKRVRVKGFREAEWQRIAPEIMKEGLLNKFKSNPN